MKTASSAINASSANAETSMMATSPSMRSWNSARAACTSRSTPSRFNDVPKTMFHLGRNSA